jgi:hypothetical protein
MLLHTWVIDNEPLSLSGRMAYVYGIDDNFIYLMGGGPSCGPEQVEHC